MAESKKSFIAYSDWYGMLKELPDELVGKLIKHIFAYVNGENPKSDDYVINALFAQIRSTLKRDLDKWEKQKEQRSKAGKMSAEVRANKSNERSTTVNDRSTNVNDRSNSLNETERNPTVNVNVNDNVFSKYNTLSEIKNFNEELKTFKGDKRFLFLAYRYWELWITEFPNHQHLKTARVEDWYDAIRLLVNKDKHTTDRIVAVYIFLTKCQQKVRGYDTYLFTKVKSLTALRDKTASGEYRMDALASLTNEKIESDDDFGREVKNAITKFNEKFNESI